MTRLPAREGTTQRRPPQLSYKSTSFTQPTPRNTPDLSRHLKVGHVRGERGEEDQFGVKCGQHALLGQVYNIYTHGGVGHSIRSQSR